MIAQNVFRSGSPGIAKRNLNLVVPIIAFRFYTLYKTRLFNSFFFTLLIIYWTFRIILKTGYSLSQSRTISQPLRVGNIYGKNLAEFCVTCVKYIYNICICIEITWKIWIILWSLFRITFIFIMSAKDFVTFHSLIDSVSTTTL